jgi:GMP synthase-like glutamine amidotransferase
MKLTILETGVVPEPLRNDFQPYPKMFEAMFERTGLGFTFETIAVRAGQLPPEPTTLEGIVITGSSAGVYDDLPWMEPLREFIRKAYANSIPMLGICFGHQIIADALGGDVRKSEKGWGLGRHSYALKQRPDFLADAPEVWSVACSHQDQVIVAPEDAEVILGSDFTPNAGLAYRNGATLSFQFHPEFEDDYASALIHLRRGIAADDVVETALASVAKPSDSVKVASYIGQFFKGR